MCTFTEKYIILHLELSTFFLFFLKVILGQGEINYKLQEFVNVNFNKFYDDKEETLKTGMRNLRNIEATKEEMSF